MRATSKLLSKLPAAARQRLNRSLGVKLLLTPRFGRTLGILGAFLFSRKSELPFASRLELIRRFNRIDNNVHCAHSFDELLVQAHKILSIPSSVAGNIVEAGAFKGGGTAKLSVIAKYARRRLVVFDSFEGLPDNEEPVAETTMGYSAAFKEGEYCGSLNEVESNVESFGEIGVCRFVKGWFADTLPGFTEEVVSVFCDVDLESSNRTCLKYLWPRIVPRGFFFSQDAHIPIVQQLFRDEAFWKEDVGEKTPPDLKRISNRFAYFEKT